ncbi:winged helix-turn-helix domain-containing protein [Halococcus sp. IIIV-5B]|uniref:helix-turn-helix transcriptional regulator n=1 Tax=Halococcus sp. IIIV-5B TaxID=2321230 RepID=UPI000E708401|nr:MarR family transcriptional regulator [Halococcus sp. IIIV-5B]RJT07534.1 MarR family transcriptional regulator [Halococcus sp. IIIV-5B]
MGMNTSSLEKTVYQRGELLCAINNQPRAKPGLTEEVQASRSTVDRAITELETAGCIERRENEYYTTLLGELSSEWYRKFQDNVTALNESQEILAQLSRSTPLDTSFLQGAHVRTADPVAPENVIEPSIRILKTATRLRGLAPVGMMVYITIIHECATTNGLSVEIVAKNDALDSILELDRAKLIKLVNDGMLEILTTSADLPYALWLMDTDKETTAGITTYNEGGVSGMIMNDSPEAIDWAESEYERYRGLATNTSTKGIIAE